jgi:hypothetical protein
MSWSAVYSPSVNELFSSGDPRETWQWYEGDPDYVARFGFTAEHVPQLIDLATTRADDDGWPDDDSVYGPIHAWRALGQLRAVEAVEPLLGILNKLDERGDDWHLEEFYRVFGLIGPAAIPALAAFMSDERNADYPRISAAHGLCEIAKQHPDSRMEVLLLITAQLDKKAQSKYELNAFYVGYLLELKAVESAEVMERAYAAGVVDEGVYGEWDHVRQELGVEGLGLPQPKMPHNSMADVYHRLDGGAADTTDRKARRQRAKKLKAERKQQQKSRKRNRKRR